MVATAQCSGTAGRLALAPVSDWLRTDEVESLRERLPGNSLGEVGTIFTLDLRAEAGDLDADLVVEAVDELWRRRIIREFGDG